MSLCDVSCLPCVYSSSVSGWICCCDYFLIMREPRGCRAGKGCTRRATGEKRVSPDAQAFLLPPGAGKIETEADRVAATKIAKKNEMPEQPEKEPAVKPEKPAREYLRDPALDALSPEERGRVYAQRARARAKKSLRGRQHAVIWEFAKANDMRYADMANMIGVKPKTLAKWASENARANWEKLAKLGIVRPEGL
ncbi:MAG: hypothetical protein J6T26_07715 [Firmicutes bacterium]|nr:hypothetical protein [Bacillota bacterium]